MRLQIVRHLDKYNREHPEGRVFVIEYDDFAIRFWITFAIAGARAAEQEVLAEWKLWDHMDAILSLGVTALIDSILEVKQPSGPLSPEAAVVDSRRLDGIRPATCCCWPPVTTNLRPKL